jgi:hypothetical protein
LCELRIKALAQMDLHRLDTELAGAFTPGGDDVPRGDLRVGRWSLACWLLVWAMCPVVPAREATAEVVRRAQPVLMSRGSATGAERYAWHRVPPEPAGNTQPDLPTPTEPGVRTTIADAGLKPLAHVNLDIRPKPGELPADVAAERFAQAGWVAQGMGTSRPWELYAFWWQTPGLCHQPLYFEQVNLERYGYSCGKFQPVLSAAHFFGTVGALPYLMTVDPPHQCVYTLGHSLPGSCVPDRNGPLFRWNLNRNCTP